VNAKAQKTSTGPDPHKSQHLGPQLRANIQTRLTSHHIPEDGKHNGSNDSRGGGQQRGHKGKKRQRERPPTRVPGQDNDEDSHEIHDRSGDEEGEHEIRRDPDEVQDIVDLGRQDDSGAGQELREQDLHGIEPVERLRRRAIGDALVAVALAVVPQADLVEVVQAERAGDGVHEDEVRAVEGFGVDVGEVEVEDPGGLDDGFGVDVADYGLVFFF
jgi:hypothetical protein